MSIKKFIGKNNYNYGWKYNEYDISYLLNILNEK